MFRKILIGLTVSSLSLYGSLAMAKPDQACGSKFRVFVTDIELTEEQKAIVYDLKEMKRGEKGERGVERHGPKHQWMIGYLEGSLDREEIHAQIDEHAEKKYQQHLQTQELLFELVDSYTPEQREQVLANMEERKSCHQQKSEEYQEKAHHHRDKHRELLMKDMNLTEEQQRELRKIKEERKEERHEYKEDRKEYKEALLEDFASGKINKREAKKEIERVVEERTAYHHEGVDAWMQFIDTLSEEQREQLLDNMEELHARKKEHRNRR